MQSQWFNLQGESQAKLKAKTKDIFQGQGQGLQVWGQDQGPVKDIDNSPQGSLRPSRCLEVFISASSYWQSVNICVGS